MKLPIYTFCLSDKDRDTIVKKEINQSFEFVVNLWDPSLFSFTQLHKMFTNSPPAIILTIGNGSYNVFNSFHFEIRKKWVHFKTVEEVHDIFASCFMNAITNHPMAEYNPLLSVITSSFNSGDRIMRPYRSLMNQTYTNWEWIIIDDTFDDKDDNLKRLKELSASDMRIRVCKFSRHSGYIGEMKAAACGLARGKWLIELDHDDDIVPDLFQWIVKASSENPEVGFICSDFIELMERDNSSFCYGEYFGLGFGAYHKQSFKGRWQNVCHTPHINSLTARHIVGVPNHIRCWRKDVYNKIGGHNYELPVADDYELILRTINETKWLRICELGYLQYRNEGGSNFTFLRNALIQSLVSDIRVSYDQKIKEKFEQLTGKDEFSYKDVPLDWTVSKERFKRTEVLWKANKDVISIVLPTYNRPAMLKTAIESVLSQTHQNWELYVIGDKCPEIERVMNTYFNKGDDRIRWWNLHTNNGAGGAVPRNYALKMLVDTEWVAYLDDDNTWEPTHLQTLVETRDANPEAQYIFSSMKVHGRNLLFKEPKKGRIDTSCVLHKRDLLFNYGYWKNRIEGGYAHDWELFSRWKDEKYAVTLKPTLNYNLEVSGQTFDQIYYMYDDQN